MKIWKNTATLNGFDDGLVFTDNKDEAGIVLMGSKPIELSEFPILKGIFRAGIGRDNIPIDAATEQGIQVAFPASATVDMIFEETADFTCGLILRRLYDDVGTIEPWFKSTRLQMSARNLLVVGNGNIGSRVAGKMSKFMNVSTYDALQDNADLLSERLSTADCVTLHIPNTLENKNFFDGHKLGLMKTGSILINTARGPIVDEGALYEEIKSGRLKAAFDVYWKEPYRGKLMEFHPQGFFMTPHVASTCNGFLKGCREALDGLIEGIEND
jgi:phosphoglycerate dehydrogenase-like enzyme